MDPQHCLLLSSNSAVLNRQRSTSFDVGVFVGISSSDYNSLLLKSITKIPPFLATGIAMSCAAGRVSYFFGLKGPAVSIDTACSSSLVALFIARHSILQSQGIQSSIVSGVNTTILKSTSLMFESSGMLARDGRCKTLDARADGYVRGESCGTLLLEPAGESCRDGQIVVAGSSINQDGRSSTLTAPNGPSQQEVVRGALMGSPLSADDICGIEMHGTGTSLGDPIELGALQKVFERSRSSIPLTLSSSKSWIGHAEPAAGVNGLLNVVTVAAKHASRPIMHLTSVNPYIANMVSSVGTKADLMPAFHMPREYSEVYHADKIAIGVSSFAFQGTNAHAVVVEDLPGGRLSCYRGIPNSSFKWI